MEEKQVRITFVPVAHISNSSPALVRKAIKKENPQLIGVELCRERLESMVRSPRAPSIGTVIAHPTFAIMFAAQQLLGKWWNLKPGEELREALRVAREMQKPVVLLDRNMSETARQIEKIPLHEKIGLLFSGGSFPKIKDFSSLTNPKALAPILSKMEKEFPCTYGVFVESRNRHMVEKLLFHKPESAVIIVGAAHVPGMVKMLKESKIGKDAKIRVAR